MPDVKEFEVKIPSANTADEWNTAIAEGAKAAGVPVPGAEPDAAAVAAAAAAKKKEDETVIYEFPLTVGGKEIVLKDADPENLMKQVAAALAAAQPAPAAAVVEEKKPAITDAELFDIRTKLMTGDVTVIDDYILKSGLLGKYLESQGLNVEQLKAATTKVQSDGVHDAWKDATDQFNAKVKAGEIDFPGGAANMKMMGYTLARLGLKPSLDSMVKAYDEMKREGLVFPVTAAAAAKAGEESAGAVVIVKKQAASSTAIGAAGGGKEVQAPVIDANRKFEIDMTTQSVAQASAAYNQLLQQGVKPEQIVVKR